MDAAPVALAPLRSKGSTIYGAGVAGGEEAEEGGEA
jgi:hypothetical protein